MEICCSGGRKRETFESNLMPLLNIKLTLYTGIKLHLQPDCEAGKVLIALEVKYGAGNYQQRHFIRLSNRNH
jgi:hypothetical protein